MRPTPRAFLIGKPLNSGSADVQVHGDGIRPYIGYDLLENRLVFVKDYWRDRDSYQELDAYQRLQENNAQYVATAIAGGDVGGTTPQRTVNQMYMHNQYAYIHHIVVLKEVCRPLATYENSGVLLAAIYHGVIGTSDLHGYMLAPLTGRKVIARPGSPPGCCTATSATTTS